MKISRITVELKPGEKLDLSGTATIEMLHKSGHLARFCVHAPLNVVVSKKLEVGPDSRAKHGILQAS